MRQRHGASHSEPSHRLPTADFPIFPTLAPLLRTGSSWVFPNERVQSILQALKVLGSSDPVPASKFGGRNPDFSNITLSRWNSRERDTPGQKDEGSPAQTRRAGLSG
jgi:hypothetical protein